MKANMSDDSLLNSLRQSTPDVPTDIKSRLLYECGMAAAETKIRNQRWKSLTSTAVALLLATGIGVATGSQFSNPTQQIKFTAVERVPEAKQALTPNHYLTRRQNSTTLAAAMPFTQVAELLERKDPSIKSELLELPASIETPISTRSLLNELN